jgi:hypothetical protein
VLDYHSHPALSASKLKTIISGTPRDYWAKHVDPDRKPFLPTDAMRQGSLVDCLITEPREYSTRYLVAPQCDRRTKEGKAIWSEFQAEAAGREVITRDWEDNALRIVEALMRDSDAAPLLRDGQGQDPHFWYDAEMGIDCRYKPDVEHPDRGILVDLKKSRTANPRMFAAQSYSLAYDLQMAHYSAGWADRYGEAPHTHILIAYEWQWPHNISVNVLSPGLIEEGHRRREEAIVAVKRFMELDQWPSWGTVEMDVPRWAHADDPANATDADDLELEGLE